MKNLFTLIGSFFFIIIMWLVVYRYLPDQLPMHFSGNEVDKFGSKFSVMNIFLLISFIIFGIAYLFLKFDNKNPNKAKINKPVLLITVLFVAGLNVVYLLNTSNPELDVKKLFFIFIGLTITIFGNYIPELKYNNKIGVRIPQSLKNSDNWRKIQRFSGKVFFIIGILIATTAFLKTLLSFIFSLLLIALGFIIINLYSNKLDL
ncbi:UNVERIFIED_ORG: putative membrane protein [Heyndrickxia coagulans]